MVASMLGFKDKIIESHIELYGDPDSKTNNQYSFFFFSKIEFKENDIFQIYAKTAESRIRAGWLFPVSVLGSREHDFWENPHFSVYAKIGGGILTSYTGDDLSEDTHILILKDATIAEYDIYVENTAVSLLKHGYYPIVNGAKFHNSLCTIDNNETKNISVEKHPEISSHIPYIPKLVQEFLPKTTDPLSRFISIYQVYELLMEKYFNYKIDEYRALRATIGTIREKISDLSSEKKLIQGVFSHCKLRNNIDENERALAKNLFGTDKDDAYYKGLQLQSLIYDIRNAIIHNYHKYELSDLMRDIAERMEIILFETLENSQVSALLAKAPAPQPYNSR